MTTEESTMTTSTELHAELKSLLRRAHTNGIDVEGGWACRNDAEHPDWDIVVTEVQKQDEA
ncbi:hypothetical protein [Halobacterium zhouii]|uniref:hypothetical protein n=1 Tax=Halobacterium zhouii TaxID=2902624 RepID=UPI001E419C3B|nr:hypothetical protein [Halobacterium zhouii]